MKIMSSFKYAFAGIAAACKTEINFRIEIVAAIIVTAAGFYFKISLTEWLVVVFNIAVVLSLELINTAIEKACDLFTTQQNAVIKIIKDVAAAAVLVAAVGAFISGVIIFLPKIISLTK